jgi:hypothetical protein
MGHLDDTDNIFGVTRKIVYLSRERRWREQAVTVINYSILMMF